MGQPPPRGKATAVRYLHRETAVLARYQIIRGKRPPSNPLPAGKRIDVRKHTRHVLGPPPEWVAAYLADPSESSWRTFAKRYAALLKTRYSDDDAPFDALAALASTQPVFIGCNCPTAMNPDVRRCHTVVALEFMQAHYPDLDVRMP